MASSFPLLLSMELSAFHRQRRKGRTNGDGMEHLLPARPTSSLVFNGGSSVNIHLGLYYRWNVLFIVQFSKMICKTGISSVHNFICMYAENSMFSYPRTSGFSGA